MKPEKVIVEYWTCGKYNRKHDSEEEAQLCIDKRLEREQLIKKFGVCDKCDGEGWVWGHELDSYYPDPHDCYSDDTRYTCDKCGGAGYNAKKN
jgi:hypothetical protein